MKYFKYILVGILFIISFHVLAWNKNHKVLSHEITTFDDTYLLWVEDENGIKSTVLYNTNQEFETIEDGSTIRLSELEKLDNIYLEILFVLMLFSPLSLINWKEMY